MDRTKTILNAAAMCGASNAEQVGDRSNPEAWRLADLTAADMQFIADQAGPDEDGDEGPDTIPLDVDVLDAARAKFYAHMGPPRTLREALAAFQGAFDELEEHGVHRWSDGLDFGGPPPPDTAGVWSWDERQLLVGEGSDDAEIVDRLDHALTQLMDDPQAQGSEHWWAEVWRAVGRGERPGDDWSRAVDGLDAMLTARADDADAKGWTGRYPAALRGLALAARAVSDKGKPSGQAIRAAVGAAEGGVSERTVRYWLSGQQPMPWSAWAALRGMLNQQG